MLVVVGAFLLLFLGETGDAGWSQPSYLKLRATALIETLRPRVLTLADERALTPGADFKECSGCPQMVVVPAGGFMMGSPVTEEDRPDNEAPQHKVVIANAFAVSRFEATFEEWDVCVTLGGCPAWVADPSRRYEPGTSLNWYDGQRQDLGWGHESRPVINVTWIAAQQYAAWLSKRTGKTYRLLSEAEFEYAARAGSDTAYSWGNEIGQGNANCQLCGTEWGARQTAPVGAFAANAFGLYDMVGNVWEWVQDCYHHDYRDAPADGSAQIRGDCIFRVLRGGSWGSIPPIVRSASRGWQAPDSTDYTQGFRVARTLSAGTDAAKTLPATH